MTNKIKDISKTLKRIGSKTITKGLRATSVNIAELTKEEAEKYIPLGSPVMMPEVDQLWVCSFGSRMLNQYGFSFDAVVGYRVLDMSEELDFRKECKDMISPIVVYYGR